MMNRVLDDAWRALRARVLAHGVRAFTETGRLETVVNVEVHEIDSRTARITARVSDGAILCADFDLWNAALAQGLDCFGSAARPN